MKDAEAPPWSAVNGLPATPAAMADPMSRSSAGSVTKCQLDVVKFLSAAVTSFRYRPVNHRSTLGLASDVATVHMLVIIAVLTKEPPVFQHMITR
jgi:hypothetical protein